MHIPSNTRPIPQQVADVISYEHPRLIKRYATDYRVSEDTARQRFIGLKQFLTVCAMMPGAKITSDTIDSMWHTFLLFTSDYRQFCESYLGRFIHHEPFEVPNPGAYIDTRHFAEQLFGPLNPELWPISAKGDCSSGCCEG